MILYYIILYHSSLALNKRTREAPGIIPRQSVHEPMTTGLKAGRPKTNICSSNTHSSGDTNSNDNTHSNYTFARLSTASSPSAAASAS